jgi:hypothetical protein
MTMPIQRALTSVGVFTFGGRAFNTLGTRSVNKPGATVQNPELSTGGSPVGLLPVNTCGRESAGENLMGVGRTRTHPQSTALITTTIFLQDLEMTTMGECDHAVHV